MHCDVGAYAHWIRPLSALPPDAPIEHAPIVRQITDSALPARGPAPD
ncbi:hypothetical protein [Xylophilus ampelinus]|uniref:Uncharacterized protein n=1 Tax=Xylophilus ampelinus TaxID=54067 RepID=A0A318SJW9_9BURK|nr:hypothetical protein [Xylophilus ampelinus]MCS4511183.1 hypothetical protein [Xylophilus ampelinus]PYE75063.1 hypothetical protein DFQ15_12016 [Xylophilus ampelinus]